MDKEEMAYILYVHTQKYYSAIKKEWNFAIHNMMDLEGIMPSVTSQRKKDKFCMMSPIHGI